MKPTVAVVLLGLAAALSACASAPRAMYTEADQDAAFPMTARTIRFWADGPGKLFASAARRSGAEDRKPFTYLALSGGGGGGAYGAGILDGWTRSGYRPEFTVVSGVSTGALIAPFAFLGPDYDAMLAKIYTSGDAENLIRDPNPFSAVFGAGLFGRQRLRDLVQRYIDDDLLAAIAREDKKGRRLLVVTTDLDAGRAVIWDLGAIAEQGGPQAFKLFRDVLAASASVPVVFAPQLIDVATRDRQFQEMHVDGAVSAPLFTLPDAFLLGGGNIAAGAKRPELYIIVNGRIDPVFEVVPDQTTAIAARAASTLNRVGTQAALAQTFAFARREGFGFHLAYVGTDAPPDGPTGFETTSMRALYAYGLEKASTGAFFVSKPPRVEAAEAAAGKVASRSDAAAP